MNQAQTSVQLFLHGHCFDQYQTTAPHVIRGQIRNHIDAGWVVSDARRFRCNGQSTFHVYFVRPNDKTNTATAVFAPAGTPTPEPAEDECIIDGRVVCETCGNTFVTYANQNNTQARCGRCEPRNRPNIPALKRRASIAALALCLLTSQHAGAASLPTGCTVVGVTSEQDEGFPLAHCTDGTYQYQDLDSGGAWKDARSYAVQRFSHH